MAASSACRLMRARNSKGASLVPEDFQHEKSAAEKNRQRFLFLFKQ
jgi:hypothetical protein